jgi:hypothetical protein
VAVRHRSPVLQPLTRSGLPTDWIGVSGDIGRMCPATDSQVLELDRFATICADCLHVQLAAAAVGELNSLCAISAPTVIEGDSKPDPVFRGYVRPVSRTPEPGGPVAHSHRAHRRIELSRDGQCGAALSVRFHQRRLQTDQPQQFPQHQPATRATASNTFRAI